MRYEALKTLSILHSRLTEAQEQTLNVMAVGLADDSHEGIRGEALLRIEAQVDDG